MKAVVLENKGVLTYQEMAVPRPRPGHALMQVKAASICGSDILRFAKGHRTYPMILGHECAGVVVEVGAGVDSNLIGQHAAVIPLIPCFQCPQCQLGLYSACHNYSFIGSRQSGGFADFLELPEKNLFLIPETMNMEDAALIEPSTVARHILDLGEFRSSQTAIVLGAGSMGLMAVQWLRILGAGLIICTDVVDENLEVARQLGAQVTLNPQRDDIKADVRKHTGDGVDLAIEAAGASQTLLQSIQVTAPRGAVVFGGNQPSDANLPMSFIEDIMRKELRINGCFMSYSAPFPGHEWTETLNALGSGKLDMRAMISHRYSLSQTPFVFDEIITRKIPRRKIILYPHDEVQPYGL